MFEPSLTVQSVNSGINFATQRRSDIVTATMKALRRYARSRLSSVTPEAIYKQIHLSEVIFVPSRTTTTKSLEAE